MLNDIYRLNSSIWNFLFFLLKKKHINQERCELIRICLILVKIPTFLHKEAFNHLHEQ